MDFDLSPEASQIVGQIARWNARDRANLGDVRFSAEEWRSFVGLGVFELAGDPAAQLEIAAALIETGKRSFPGPVLEAVLAVRSGSHDAEDALRQGKIVTSVPRPRKTGRQIVPWGAVADLVVDQETGATLARGPLPEVKMAYPLHAGWIDRDVAATGSPESGRKAWSLAAAAVAGLGIGAVEMARTHSLDRIAFGKPIAAQQSLQHRLVESHVMIEAARLGALDAASRVALASDNADVAGALAWLWAARAAERVRRHCHQVFGASGFCYETGLVKLTWQMDLIRLELGTKGAVARIMTGRDRSSKDPPVNVLAGYSRGPAPQHPAA